MSGYRLFFFKTKVQIPLRYCCVFISCSFSASFGLSSYEWHEKFLRNFRSARVKVPSDKFQTKSRICSFNKAWTGFFFLEWSGVSY